jgi:phosphoacetylglucosamine mutase
LLSALTTFITALKIDLSKPSCVVYGRDTRPSGPELVQALEAGLQSMRTGLQAESGAHLERWDDRGVVTTPVLHYIVRGLNLSGKSREEYGEPTFEGYLHKMADSFCKLMVGISTRAALRYLDG